MLNYRQRVPPATGKCWTGDWWPQPALVIIGVPGSGKSAIQKAIITPILGRSIDPTKYFTADTSFNSHLGKAEHLVLDDPKWSGKAKKDGFVAHLKGVISNEEETLHPKNKEEFKLKIFRRITISINDEEEPMSIFPLIPESTSEKIAFIRADGFSKFSPEGGPEWGKWAKRVSKELPAFLWHLLNEYSIPAEIFSKRYGVAYRNEEILARIAAPSAEEKRVEDEEIIWEAVFGGKAVDRLSKESVKLTATGLSKRLQDKDFPLKENIKYGFPLTSVRLGRKLGSLHEEQKQRAPTHVGISPTTKGKSDALEFTNHRDNPGSGSNSRE